jgi:hypothetical protein
VGVDLRDADDPGSKLTLRRLYVVFMALPPGNAVSCAVSGITKEEISWDPSTYLLANVFDAIQQLTYLTESIHTPRNAPRPRAPKPHPRPGNNSASRPRRGDWFPGKTIKC